jgi:hypothetical protein
VKPTQFGLLIVLLFLPAVLFAQPAATQDLEVAQRRIEQAFRSASPASIGDLLTENMTIRLGSSLHKRVSSREALDLLNTFFSNKDSIEVIFGPAGGIMIYAQGGKRDTTAVDLRFTRAHGDLLLNALNISNQPLPTILMDMPPVGW